MAIGFTYRNGVLCADDLPLTDIGRRIGTPAYIYSARALEAAYNRFAKVFAGHDCLICYALKANYNLATIGCFARLGAGADVVSGGELARALAAGIPANKIVFAGVGKTEAEMEQALTAGILQFNIESEPELLALNQTALRLGKRAEIAVRINPDVDAGTHAKIATGKRGDKFGIDLDRAAQVYDLAASLPGIDAAAVAIHIGSQLTDLAPFRTAFERLCRLVGDLQGAGHKIRRIDFGGGLGIAYRGEEPLSLEAYAKAATQISHGLGCSLIFEPGRHLVGNGGVLLARVIYVKRGSSKRFLILDAAMNDLIRPALYEAYHEIVPVMQPAPGLVLEPADIVGPICESGDIFAKDRPMPPLDAGELVAILSSGAYAAVMASTYNSRPQPPEAMVNGQKWALVKPRRTLSDLFADETVDPFAKTA